jgi:hypothetical protein
MPPKYEHTQRGSRLLWGFAIFLILDIIGIEVLIYVLAGRDVDALSRHQLLVIMSLIPLIPGIILGWTFLMMSSLTVTIDDQAIRLRFGGGMWRKTIPLVNVIDCHPVKTSWIDGWGVRMYKNGWLYNIAGHDAVELVFASGRKYAIGTDEPEKLAAAIQQAIGKTA